MARKTPAATFSFVELFRLTQPYMRQRYWGVKILLILLNCLLSFPLGMLLALHPLIWVPMVLLPMTVWWISFATTLKRLRDANLNLYWALTGFIPLVNIVTFIVYGCLASSEPKNKGSAKGVVIAAALLWALFLILPILATAAYLVYNQRQAASDPAPAEQLAPDDAEITPYAL